MRRNTQRSQEPLQDRPMVEWKEQQNLENNHLVVFVLHKHLVKKPAEVTSELVISGIHREILLFVKRETQKYLFVMNMLERKLGQEQLDFLSHVQNYTIEYCQITVLTKNDVH